MIQLVCAGKENFDGLLSKKKMIVHFTTPSNTLDDLFTC